MEMASMLQQHLATGVCFLLLIGFTSALKGPARVDGFLGRPQSVVCQYYKIYRMYFKYWCKGENWNSCSTVVKTNGTEAEVKEGRTLIKDNHTRCEFTVTLENLTQQDAGFYWCVIERTGNDLGFLVNITVHPAPTTARPTTTEYFSTATITSTAKATETTYTNPFNNMILLPIVFLVLVVILVGALLLMWKIKKQKGAKAHGDITLSMAPTQTEGNPSYATVKSKLRPHRKKSPGQEATSSAGEVDYSSVITTRSPASAPQVPDDAEQVSYAALRFSALDEQPTYANVAFKT